MKPIKDLGQNFLRDIEAIKLFVQKIELDEGDLIYEIGPGEGVITSEILNSPKSFKLTTIDIDPRSKEYLQKITDQRMENITSDILKLIPQITDKNYKIVGAIPYNITSPILHKIVEKQNLPQKIVMIVQKEVGEKVCDSRKNSYLRLLLNYFYETTFVKIIKKEAFRPIPKVDSALIELNLKNEIPSINLKEYEGFLHHLFRSPRKKINKVFKKELLSSLNLDENLRPEELKLDQVTKLFYSFKNSS